jgi:hypothetical protein
MKNLKFLITVMFLSLGIGQAYGFSIDANGVLFYQKGEGGEIAVRNMTLSVPPRGEGSITLSSQNSPFDLETERFFSKKKKGRTVFYVVFEGLRQPGTQGPGSTMVLKGTYLRGSNKALYYGNVYKKKGGLSEKEMSDQYLSSLRGFKYGGGFKFEAPVSR